jgi:hypothetical protein
MHSHNCCYYTSASDYSINLHDNPSTRLDVNVRQALKWPLLRFDVNVHPAVSLIAKAHKCETNNASMMRFALACCEKDGLSAHWTSSSCAGQSKYKWRDLTVSMAGPSKSRDNGTDVREEEIVHVGLGGVSSKFVWENINSFQLHEKHFVMYMVPSSTLLN